MADYRTFVFGGHTADLQEYRDKIRQSHRGLARRFGGTSIVSKCLLHLSSRMVNLYDDVTRSKAAVSHIDCPNVTMYTRMQLNPTEDMIMTLILEFDFLETAIKEMARSRIPLVVPKRRGTITPSFIPPPQMAPAPSSSIADVPSPVPPPLDIPIATTKPSPQPVTKKKAPAARMQADPEVHASVDKEMAPPPPKRRPGRPVKVVRKARQDQHEEMEDQESVPSASNGATMDNDEPLFKDPGDIDVKAEVKEEEPDWEAIEIPEWELDEIEVIEDAPQRPANVRNIRKATMSAEKVEAIRAIVGGKMAVCPYCKEAHNAEGLDKHIRKEHKPTLPLFTCSLCNAAYKTIASMSKHLSAICPAGCLNVKEVEDCAEINYTKGEQMQRGLNTDLARTCPFCATMLESYGEVDKHLIEHHGSNLRPVYRCNECGNCELTINALFQHFITIRCSGVLELALDESDVKPSNLDYPSYAYEEEVFTSDPITDEDAKPQMLSTIKEDTLTPVIKKE